MSCTKYLWTHFGGLRNIEDDVFTLRSSSLLLLKTSGLVARLLLVRVFVCGCVTG